MPSGTGGRDGARREPADAHTSPDAPARLYTEKKRAQQHREPAKIVPYMGKRRRTVARDPDEPPATYGAQGDPRDARERTSAPKTVRHNRRASDRRSQPAQPRYDSWQAKQERQQAALREFSLRQEQAQEEVSRQTRGRFGGPEFSVNRYGLVSKAQQKYPMSFQSEAAEFWGILTEEQRLELVSMQARAMERVGFQLSNENFFIGEIEIDRQMADMIVATERAKLQPDHEGPLDNALAETEYEQRRKARFRFLKEREEIRQGKRRAYASRGNDIGFNPILTLPSLTKIISKLGGQTYDMRDETINAVTLDLGFGKESAMEGNHEYIPASGSEGAGAISSDTPRAKPEHAEAKAPAKKTMPEMWPGGGAKPIAPPTHAKHKLSGKAATGSSSTNRFGLTSRAQEMYPEAFVPVDSKLWSGLSQQQRDAVMKLQASAMERVGFEKGTDKYFIEDFDPSNPNAPAPSAHPQHADGPDLVSMAAPRFFMGGVLVGCGAMALVMALISELATTPLLAGGVVAIAAGATLSVFARN